MELISIIVPVYNVEKYVRRCIDSILTQSYKNFELILIDDGSTDMSGKICDTYLQQDERIKVIHQKNGGLSAARNAGIEVATGDYVTFIDSDDYIAQEYLLVLLNGIKKFKADISMCLGMKFFDGETVKCEEWNDNISEVFNSCDALENVLYHKKLNLYAWGKLYKSSLFEGIRFPENKLFEDVYTTYKLMDKADCILFNPTRLYYYYQRTGSIVNSEFNSKKIQQIMAAEEILEFIDEKYPDIHDAAVSKCFIAATDIYRRIPKQNKYMKEREYAERVIRDYRKIVVKDVKNKKLTRCIALIAIIDIRLLNYSGRVYQWLIQRGILRLKNPI